MKSLRAITVLLVAAACVALAGAALASKGSKPAGKLPHSTQVQKAKPLAKPAAGDTDNVQSGDQSSPDQADEQSPESSSDNEAGQAGEPAQGQGHEDPAGQDASHECTGNCQE